MRLLFPDAAAVFPQIDISVGIDLDVPSIGSEQQVKDMVAVELSHPAPAVAAILAALHLFVIVGVDAIDERPDSYLICHKAVSTKERMPDKWGYISPIPPGRNPSHRQGSARW